MPYSVSSFQDLIVWKKAMDLAVQTYALLKKYPKHELFALVNQTQRCAVSIPSNIAEGYQRQSRKEYIHFLHIALGSSAELRTQLLLANRVQYITEQDSRLAIGQLEEVEKLLKTFVRSLSKGVDVR